MGYELIQIDTLNYGIDNYNLYITHKNRQFRNPKLEDSRVKELIDNADNGVFTANEIFYGLFSSNKELNDLITDARNRMPDLISDLEREKDFVDRYLKKWKPLRIFMFLTYGYQFPTTQIEVSHAKVYPFYLRIRNNRLETFCEFSLNIIINLGHLGINIFFLQIYKLNLKKCLLTWI